MQGAMGQEIDRAVFLGTGANGQPLGLITGRATYGFALDEIDAPASWGAFRGSVAAVMAANAAGGAGAVRAMIRPELWDYLDGALITGTAVSEWDRLTRQMPSVYTTSNALAAPAGEPEATSALLTTSTGGVAPFFVGAWGAIDMIRDPYSDAQSGGLRITALATLDLIRPDMLVPCADWDLSIVNGIPRAYRVSVSEAGGGRSETVLAGEVLHVRIGSDPVAP